MVALLLVGGTVAGDDEKREQQVERFLSRLGLTDLQILNVEKRFERTSGDERVQLGQQLADLYAQRLMTLANDSEAFADIVKRVNALINDVPEANTPALQVMLLQADYNRAERLILDWLNDRDKPLDLAREILRRIAPQLDKHWRELARQSETLEDEINELDDEEAQEAKEEELRRLHAVLGRASFFAGWSNFYFGVTKQDPDSARDDFRKGRAAFRQLLGFTEDKYQEDDADWLGLESIWRSRALIGLGLCETALDNVTGAKVCFKLLEHINTPPVIRDQGPYWFVSGLLQTGHLDEATRFATEQVEKFSGGATAGKVTFCAALIRAEYSDPENSTPQTRRLAELGIHGLARLGQLGVLRKLLETYDIKLDAEKGFYLQWISGQQLFEKAEASKKKVDYEATEKRLLAALDQPEARKDLAAAAQCRFVLGWCQYRLKKFQEASKSFVDAMPALNESGEKDKAIQAAWMAFACFHSLARVEKRFVEPAIAAGKTLVNRFPDSAEAKKVGYYLAKLQKAAGKPRDRIQALKKVKSDDVNYHNAQYEICVLWYDVWRAERDTPSKAAAAAKELFDAVDHFLSVTRGGDGLRRLKGGLLAVDVAIRSASISRASQYLASLQPIADKLPTNSSQVAEFHFRKFQIARSGKDGPGQAREAEWLLKNAKGSAYEQSAVISLAKMADAALNSATPDNLADRRRRAIEVYGRLVELLGDSPRAISGSKNAQVANSKLARLEADAGDYSTAIRRLDSLLSVDPKNRDYLRRAGLAKFHGKMYAKSLGHWRVLLAGLSKGSVPWYEAKYYQLSCLLATDRTAARKVYRQFKILYPNVKDDTWRKRFAQLDRQLGN